MTITQTIFYACGFKINKMKHRRECKKMKCRKYVSRGLDFSMQNIFISSIVVLFCREYQICRVFICNSKSIGTSSSLFCGPCFYMNKDKAQKLILMILIVGLDIKKNHAKTRIQYLRDHIMTASMSLFCFKHWFRHVLKECSILREKFKDYTLGLCIDISFANPLKTKLD